MKFCVVFIFIVGLFGEVSAQDLNYTIRASGFRIGSLQAKKYMRDSLTCYEIRSRVKFWMFGRIHVQHSVVEEYHNGQLMTSKVNTTSNRGVFKSSTIWKGDRYVVDVDAYQYKKDTVIREPITYTVSRLYFDKPGQNQIVYAENFGLFTRATIRSDGVVVVPVRGHASRYHYQDGLMIRADMSNPTKNYQVRLRQE